MSRSPADQPPKRRYDNRQRAQQASRTRNAILQALAEQLVTRNSGDFSVADAAQQAGVTPRTVFRYFPTKELMLEAVSEWVLQITGKVRIPEAPDQFGETVVDSFEMFEANADLMRALLLSDLGRGVRSRLSPRRREGVGQALAPAVSRLTPAQARAVKAVLMHLLTAEAWWQIRDGFGVDGRTSATVIAWLAQLALRALANGDDPFAGGDDRLSR